MSRVSLITNLKKANTRVPYYKINIPEIAKKELENSGETIITLSLRHNYPMMTGIMYKYDKKEKSATIVSKTMKHGSYFYLLQNGKKEGVANGKK